MTTMAVLWILNAALLVVVATLARDVFGARRHRFRSQREAILTGAIRKLPPPQQIDDLLTAWSLVLDSVEDRAREGLGATLPQRILALEMADDDVVQMVRRDFEEAVKAYNGLCAFIDEGLLRPKDIAKHYPNEHQRLLRALHLVEPFIWHESILRGRGRWGYRPVRLREILQELRPVSPRSSLHEADQLVVRGLTLMSLREISPFARQWQAAKLAVRSPTISARSKIRQGALRERLTEALSALGVPLHNPPQESVEW